MFGAKMAAHQFYLAILLAVLLFQPVELDWKRRKHPLNCFTDADKSEVANLDILRFFSGIEGLYLVLQAKKIIFAQPVVKRVQNETFLVFQDPIQFIESEEVNASRVIGYVHDYYIKKTSMQYYQIHANETGGGMGEIKELVMNQPNQTDGELGRIDKATEYRHLQTLKKHGVKEGDFFVFKVTRSYIFMIKYAPKNGGTEETYELCRLKKTIPTIPLVSRRSPGTSKNESNFSPSH